MTVHIDRAHHHPRVYKRLGFWHAKCPRCGLLYVPGLATTTNTWRLALLAALGHAAGVHS